MPDLADHRRPQPTFSRRNLFGRRIVFVPTCLAVALTMVVIKADATSAAPPENQITLPAVPLPAQLEIPQDPQALEAIKRTLRGDADVHAADPMLHDVLRML